MAGGPKSAEPLTRELAFTVNVPPSSGFIEDVMGLGILSKF